MAGRSQRLEEKHPQVRHEIACDAVVRAVEQDSHQLFFTSKALPSASVRTYVVDLTLVPSGGWRWAWGRHGSEEDCLGAFALDFRLG